MKKILSVLFLGLILVACSEDDDIASSGEDLFPDYEQTELDVQLSEMFEEYNTRIQYKYIKNYIPSDWYYITPVREEIVLPMSELVVDMWIDPLEQGSSKEFVTKSFPKMLLYIGSPARRMDGSVIMGEAEGGTLVRFTNINSFKDDDPNWIVGTLHTAYHEYGHIVHQRYGFPDDFRNVTPNTYTRNGWQVVTQREALQKGVVTPYASSSPQEDFVELWAKYISATQEQLDNYFIDVIPSDDANSNVVREIEKDNLGREILRKKLNILNTYMLSVGLDMNKIRDVFQEKLNDRKVTN